MKKDKGITLVALVITIIVLLILAGISISALTGDGLFDKTEKATKAQKQAEVDEKVRLLVSEISMDKGLNATVDDFIKKLKNSEMTKDEDIKYKGDTTIIIINEQYVYKVMPEETGLLDVEYLGISSEVNKVCIPEVISTTTKSITVKANIIYLGAEIGIKEYKFSRDDGETWEETNETGEYTFDNIYGDVGGVSCNFKVEVIDEENKTEVGSIKATTAKDSTYYCDTADQLVCTLGGRKFWKDNNQGAIVGVGYFKSGTSNMMAPVLVSTSEEAVTYYSAYNYSRLVSIGSITYNGVRYYYSSDGHWMPTTSYTSNFPTINTEDDRFSGESGKETLLLAAERLLDLYYNN